MILFLRIVVQTVNLFLTCLYVYVDNNLEDVYVSRYFERTIQCKPPTGINHIPISQSSPKLIQFNSQVKVMYTGTFIFIRNLNDTSGNLIQLCY